MTVSAYEKIRGGGGFHQRPRGLISVRGKEAVQFLDGMITNDMKTLADGDQMLAAFPNAQGRLLAVVGIKRVDDSFLIETENATREKVFQNLSRFTFAGDFFVDDLSSEYEAFEIVGAEPATSIGFIHFGGPRSCIIYAPCGEADELKGRLLADGLTRIDDETFETLRIESGTPKYGVDMDETTIVPELGLDGLISYNKGCYIGQEIIARIYFRGHVAKQLTGLIFAGEVPAGSELSTVEGKNTGRVSSATFSPAIGSQIGLGYVRYDYLAAGTELLMGDVAVTVSGLPMVPIGD